MGSEIEEGEAFHYQGKGRFRPGRFYYDKSCEGKNCYSTLLSNISFLYSHFRREGGGHFFLVRDFSYEKALKEKNIPKARKILTELEEVMRYFYAQWPEGKGGALRKKDGGTLFLVTSAGPRGVEFPLQGLKWSMFEKQGKNALFRRQALLAPVMASGARAENFCGIFEESEVLRRLLWSQ